MARPGLKRGDVIIGVAPGDYGKPRPNIVVQSDQLSALDSVLVCPLTSELSTAGPTRMLIPAHRANGLNEDSLAMIDKITAISRARIRERIGQLTTSQMVELDTIVMSVLGLLDRVPDQARAP